jgi:diguanylate cyclase (GGDEF)-like protein/PAS domain S-box-containing protein
MTEGCDLTEPTKLRPLSRRFPWQLVAVFLLLAAGLFTLSRFFYLLQVRHARVYKESELATMAGLMSTRLAEWRANKMAFAAAISDNPGNVRRTEALIKDQASEKNRAAYLESLAAMQKNLSFSWAALVLADGSIVLSYPEDAAVASTPRLGHGAWQDREAQLGTVYADPATGRRSVEMMVPLVSYEGQEPRPLALLRISYDAAVSIDPILDDWPNSGPASEAVLLERQGSDFVHLSRPRLSSGATPPGPLPISRLRRPASQEALGEEGIVEGRDYRGRNVIAFIKAVPDSPWFVAVKTDMVALTSGMMESYLTLTGLAAAFVALCGALLYLFWSRTLSAQEAAERSKWDQANANLNEFMQVMIDIMPNPAFFKDTAGVYVGTNAAFEKLLGLSKDEIVGKSISDVAPEGIVKIHLEHDQGLLAKPGHQVYEAPLQAWDGEHHVIFIKSTYRCPDGTIGGIIGILKDITQRLRSEEELEQLRRFSESTIQTMTEGLVLTDPEGKFTFVNPAAAFMMGRTPSEMIGQEALSFVPKDQHALVRRADEKRTKGISDRYELVFMHKDGSRRTFLVSGGPRVQGANVGGTMAVLTDISDRKRMEEEIRALSLRDELTTLYNRRGFMTLAEQQLKTASRLKKSIALLYLDVDNLKRINDTGGHKLGDRALVEIAFILKKSFRESDIVGRLGGDEFAILAMETTKMNVGTLTERLRDKLESFNARSSAEVGFELSVSVGVFSREPDLPATVEEMISRADLLMYEQKRSKKTGEPGKPPGPSK